MQPDNAKSIRPRVRLALRASICTAAALGTASAMATTFQVTPLDLGSGFSLTGSITTDGTLGALSSTNVTGWQFTVSEVTDTFYTKANTVNVSNLVEATGNQLRVPASADGTVDGGTLSFSGGRRYAVQVADFTGPNAAGGQAYYVNGGAFDAVPLSQPPGATYVAATAASAGGSVFDLKPIAFAGGITTMTGSITTNGASGAATSIVDWNIRLRDTVTWSFDQTNTTLLSVSNLISNGKQLAITPFDASGNPGTFTVGAGRIDLTGAMLADFSADPAGQAGFFTPAIFQTITGLPLNGKGDVVIASVPEPDRYALMLAGVAAMGLMVRRKSRPRK